MNQDLSVIGKPNTICSITRSELELFILLLEHGMPIQNQIKLCFKEHEKILAQLETGSELRDLLFSEPKEEWKILKALCSFLSLKQAFHLFQQMEAHSTNLLLQLLKKISYPMLVFFFSFFILLFFIDSILPQMLAYMDPPIYLHFLEFGMKALALFFLALAALFIYIASNAYFPMVEKQLLKWPFYQTLRSIQFVTLFSALLEEHTSLADSLKFISTLDKKPHLQHIAQQALKNLEQGKEIQDCFADLDEEFHLFFHMGLESLNAVAFLKLYEKKKQQEMDGRIKTISTSMQIVSYLCVGALVIVVYEVLLSPLSLLTTF